MTPSRFQSVVTLCLLVSLLAGCSQRKSKTKSWHDMPLGFMAPAASSDSQYVAMGSPAKQKEKHPLRDKLAALGKSLQPKVRHTRVEDAVSLESESKMKDPQVYLLAAKMCAARQQWDGAIEHYKLALEMDDTNIDAIAGYGHVLTEQGKYNEAIAVYRKGIEDGNRDLRIASEIGYCFLMKGETEKSIATLEALVAEAPDEPVYRQQLAFALVTDNQPDKALEQLVATLEPTEAQLRVGKIQLDLGMKEDAARSFLAARKLAPQNREAATLLASLGINPVESSRTAEETPSVSQQQVASADVPNDTQTFAPAGTNKEPLVKTESRASLTEIATEQTAEDAEKQVDRNTFVANSRFGAKSSPLAGKRSREQFVVGDFKDNFAANSAPPLPIERDENTGSTSVSINGGIANDNAPTGGRSLSEMAGSNVQPVYLSRLSVEAFDRVEAEKQASLTAKINMINEKVARASHEDGNSKLRPLISAPRAFAKFTADSRNRKKSAETKMSDTLRSLLR